jgi:hypothetical protein
VTAENHVVEVVAGDAPKESRLLAYALRSGARLLIAGSGSDDIERWLAARRDHPAICPVIIVWTRRR